MFSGKVRLRGFPSWIERSVLHHVLETYIPTLTSVLGTLNGRVASFGRMGIGFRLPRSGEARTIKSGCIEDYLT